MKERKGLNKKWTTILFWQFCNLFGKLSLASLSLEEGQIPLQLWPETIHTWPLDKETGPRSKKEENNLILWYVVQYDPDLR